MIKKIQSFETNSNYVYNNFYITIIAAYIVAYSVFYFLLPVVLPVSLFLSSIVFSITIALFGFITAKVATKAFFSTYEIVNEFDVSSKLPQINLNRINFSLPFNIRFS